MPIYEYQCAACGRIVEKWQKFSEAPLLVCAHCGGSLSKVISACAFHLKGSGWYATDYTGKSNLTKSPDKGKETQEAKDSGEVKDTPEASRANGKEGEKSGPSPPPKFKCGSC